MRLQTRLDISGIILACAVLGATCTKNPEISNNPPKTPQIDQGPANGASGVSIAPALGWTCGDPEGDPLTFDVHLGIPSPPPLVSPKQSTMTYIAGVLSYSTTYYWRIVARDEHGDSTGSETWSFTTLAEATRISISQGNLGFSANQNGAVPNSQSFTIRGHFITS